MSAKRLLLLRHAKSSWDDPDLDDIDRPLAPRGVRAAARVAEWLRTAALDPDVVACSPALRARQTVEGIRPGLRADTEVSYDRALYDADTEDLMDWVQQLPAKASSALVVGHNPGLQDLAILLAGTGDADALGQLEEKLPTGSLVVLDFDATSWRDVRPGSARLSRFVRPRDLAD